MLSGLESPFHLLLVLAIAMLVFGPKRLPEVGRSIGSGLRQFRDAVAGEHKPAAPRPADADPVDPSPDSEAVGDRASPHRDAAT